MFDIRYLPSSDKFDKFEQYVYIIKKKPEIYTCVYLQNQLLYEGE